MVFPTRFSRSVVVGIGAVAVLLGLAAPTSASAQELAPSDALSAALASNPSFRAALAEVVAAREATHAAVNARRPVFAASANASYNENLSATGEGVARNASRSVQSTAGIAYTTDWGTTVQLDATTNAQWRDVNRDPSTTTTVELGPTYTAEVALTARQPLLRGAGSDAVLAGIREARLGETQSRFERDQTVSEIAQDVLVAYWELWYADQALEVQKEALALAERQELEARQRAQLGTIAQSEVLRFATELASLREAVATATSTHTARAIELGRLMGLSPTAAVRLVASADAPPTPTAPAANTLINEARGRSPELLALETQIAIARQQTVVAADDKLARLDVVGTAGMAGLWTDDRLDGLALPNDRPAFFATVGLEFELPIGPSVGQANYARSIAQLDATEARYTAGLQALEARIASLRDELVTAGERVTLATETARIAAELAEAERQRVALGTTTPVDLLLAQQSARETALRRLRALVDAVSAGLQLDHASGRLLQRFSLSPRTTGTVSSFQVSSGTEARRS